MYKIGIVREKGGVSVCERGENGREGERGDVIGYRGERQGEGKDGGGEL